MSKLETMGFGSMLGQLNRMVRGALTPAATPVAPSPGMGSDQFVRSGIPLPPSGTFQLHSQGPGVAALQAQLIALGYLSGTPDGLYSQGTAQAIWYFQQEYGRVPNGNCDADDLAMMDSVLRGAKPRLRPAPVAPDAPAQPEGPMHRVQGGETLSDLAQYYLGDSSRWVELMQLNRSNVMDPNHLEPGWLIRLPAGTQPPLHTLAPQNPFEAMRARTVEIAKQYLGVPYVWGGTTPKGFDCSGLMQYTFQAMGIAIPRVAADQFRAGQAVDKADLKPGDAVFFHDTGSRSGITHVGMYIGNGQFLQAPKTGDVVKISALNEAFYQAHYAGARRYIA